MTRSMRPSFRSAAIPVSSSISSATCVCCILVQPQRRHAARSAASPTATMRGSSSANATSSTSTPSDKRASTSEWMPENSTRMRRGRGLPGGAFQPHDDHAGGGADGNAGSRPATPSFSLARLSCTRSSSARPEPGAHLSWPCATDVPLPFVAEGAPPYSWPPREPGGLYLDLCRVARPM